MDMMQAFWLAVVEGLTEYIPVSSTGHIILTSWMMGINQDEFVKDYTVMVQFGAILAVLFVFWRRFILNFKIYPQIAVAVAPAIVIGLLVKKKIDLVLGNVWIVAASLLVGGIALVLTDGWIRRRPASVPAIEKLSWPAAFKVGVFQCLAFIPGISRSAASIWGGVYQGLSLELATEFSFFLAVPTLTGATLLKLLKVWPTLTGDKVGMLLMGNAVSFIVGVMAIRFFVHILSRHGLKFFGYYRIALGLLVLAVLFMGHELSVV
jgi:undecaprenyl-diphosphatase